jgi:hypothetical protein
MRFLHYQTAIVLGQCRRLKIGYTRRGGQNTHIFLLLMDMANLEPNIVLREGSWWRAHYEFEALIDRS